MAIFPELERCGWEFKSDGIPCVAQRVWPIPRVLPLLSWEAAVCSKSETFPFVLTTVLESSKSVIPALSYPLYSRRFKPLMMMGYASR